MSNDNKTQGESRPGVPTEQAKKSLSTSQHTNILGSGNSGKQSGGNQSGGGSDNSSSSQSSDKGSDGKS